MDEKSTKNDEKANKIKERQAFLDKINEQTAAKITSWADLYTAMKNQIAGYLDSPSKTSADFTIALFNCFVLALEDLPEEGDAQVIYRHINKILIMEPERTGMYVPVGDEVEELQKRKAEAVEKVVPLLASVIAQALGISQADEDSMPSPAESPESKPKRTLH